MLVRPIECTQTALIAPSHGPISRASSGMMLCPCHVHLTAGHDLGSVWFEPHA